MTDTPNFIPAGAAVWVAGIGEDDDGLVQPVIGWTRADDDDTYEPVFPEPFTHGVYGPLADSRDAAAAGLTRAGLRQLADQVGDAPYVTATAITGPVARYAAMNGTAEQFASVGLEMVDSGDDPRPVAHLRHFRRSATR